jgi:hypothetical protein
MISRSLEVCNSGTVRAMLSEVNYQQDFSENPRGGFYL